MYSTAPEANVCETAPCARLRTAEEISAVELLVPDADQLLQYLVDRCCTAVCRWVSLTVEPIAPTTVPRAWASKFDTFISAESVVLMYDWLALIFVCICPVRSKSCCRLTTCIAAIGFWLGVSNWCPVASCVSTCANSRLRVWQLVEHLLLHEQVADARGRNANDGTAHDYRFISVFNRLFSVEMYWAEA